MASGTIVMGICLSALVKCFTRCHDRYISWKWDQSDEVMREVTLMETIQLQNTTKLQRLRSIHTAVIDKNTSEMRRMLAEQPEAGQAMNNYGETPLHLACKLGYCSSIDTLLESSPNAATVCTEIGTPVHCITKAVRTGYMSTQVGRTFILKLIQHGADVNAVDKGHKTALFIAAEIGNFELMEVLIAVGSSINCKDINGFTPLYMAAIRGDLRGVRHLLATPGVEVDACDEAGRTPLIASLITIMNNLRYENLPCDGYYLGQTSDNSKALLINRHNRIAVVEALLKAGANPNECDTHSRSPLAIAFVILEMDNIRGIAGQALSGKTVAGQPSSSGILRTNFTDREMVQSLPESVYTPLARMLVLYGAHMPASWDKDVSKSPEWLQQLYQESRWMWKKRVIEKPFRLIHLSRMAIRTQMALCHQLMNIDQLPVPDKLQAYIEMRYY